MHLYERQARNPRGIVQREQMRGKEKEGPAVVAVELRGKVGSAA